ncbi:Mss4-like protein [Aspergillus undulatus]|uniref:Mss4-like protein n=1 Tax=Aspergillus undulatus TaxID=1810928 RepID=UPI003CCD917D
MSKAQDRTLTAACHCRSVHFTLTLPTSTFPLQAHICHCAICRTTHGALASFHAPLPMAIEAEFITPSSTSNMTGYTHVNATSTRYFCSTCGCHIADREKGWREGGEWNVSISIFDQNNNQACWVIDEHYFVGSTGNGTLPDVNRDKGKITAPKPDQAERKDKDKQTFLAKCHCDGVSFNISRPRQEYINFPTSNGWIHESDASKWLALIDACSNCRLVTGSHAIGWLFVSMEHITPSLPDNLLIGTSESHVSSKGVYRTFCGKCGATVLYSHTSRPGVVDVATGILHAKEGVMLRIQLSRPRDAWGYSVGLVD